jgi:hypothetical protein
VKTGSSASDGGAVFYRDFDEARADERRSMMLKSLDDPCLATSR